MSNRSIPILAGVALLSLVACGDPQGTSAAGTPAEGASAPGSDEPTSVAPLSDADREGRAQAQSELILGAGAGVEYGNLGREGFEALQTTPETTDGVLLGTTWSELTALPAVASAYSFALAASDVDSKAHLAFMFDDAAYRAQLATTGVLWAGEGAYYGDDVIALYGLTGSGAAAVWTPYQGRYTPQTYSFSELRYDNGSSFYTTSYAPFGGLISVIKDGGKGVYALTPATTTQRAHSVAFNDHVLYALAAQASIGLTLSTTPIASFGNLNDLWVNEATIETSTANAALPELINAGGTLVGAYVLASGAVVRATTTPSTVTTAANFTQIGACSGATKVDTAYAGSFLYVACLSSGNVLSVKKANISNLASITWNTVSTPGLSGTVTDFDLSGQGPVIALALRQGTSIKVLSNITDTAPSFNMVLPGTFALQPAAEGLVLSVCDLTGTAKQVRTFLK